MSTEKNNNIKCSVSQCQYNLETENYCTLDSIKVGCSEANVTSSDCTECDSFEARM